MSTPPNPDPTSQARAMDTLIRQAAEELAASERDREQDGLLFLGAWHDAYPAILVRDPLLTDSAKVHLLYLLQEARQRPHGAIAMPTLEQTSGALGQSRNTTIRDRLLLRVTRWISLCARVRDPGTGRFRGSVHAIHGEPCSLADATHLDDAYIKTLDDTADHDDPYVRRAARAALAGIRKDVTDNRDPLEQPDPIARRIEATRTIREGTGAFFGIYIEPKKVATATDHQVQNLDSAPRPKFGPGSETPSPKFGPGDQVYENKEKPKFGPGPRSSSKYKTTTTTKTATNSKFEAPQPLRWPDGFDDNQRRLIHRVLCDEIATDQHQHILDVLAQKSGDPTNPIRNPVKYAAALCRRVQSGTFHVVGPAASAAQTGEPGGKDAAERAIASHARSVEHTNLRGEIAALERMVNATRAGAARCALESQLENRRSRLAQEFGTSRP